jgi:hypothetical protein
MQVRYAVMAAYYQDGGLPPSEPVPHQPTLYLNLHLHTPTRHHEMPERTSKSHRLFPTLRSSTGQTSGVMLAGPVTPILPDVHMAAAATRSTRPNARVPSTYASSPRSPTVPHWSIKAYQRSGGCILRPLTGRHCSTIVISRQLLAVQCGGTALCF